MKIIVNDDSASYNMPSGAQFHTSKMATWEQEARNILRAQMSRNGESLKGLCTKLAALGIQESQANLSNKISRGKFSFVFFLQCMHAMNVTSTEHVLDVETPPVR